MKTRVLIGAPASPRFTTNLGFLANPTRFPKIEIFLVAWRAADHMLPLLILLDVLELRRSNCEAAENFRFRATAPFGVGVGILYPFLILPLQAIPPILRRFSIHVASNYGICLLRILGLFSPLGGKFCLIHRQNRFFSASGFGS